MNDAVIVDSIVKPEVSRASRLPVISISLRAYSSLFVYLSEFGRLVWLTFLLALGAQLIHLLLWYLEPPEIVTDGWALGAHFVIFVPFLVSWTQLMVDGPQRIVAKRPFRYGPIEWRYLLADVVTTTVLLAPLVLLAKLSNALRLDQYVGTGSFVALLASYVVFCGALLISFAVSIRLSFLFPAIALNRYQGVAIAWKQTAGYIERLGLILGITFLPFFFPYALLLHGEAQKASALAVVPAEVLKLILIVLTLTMTTGAMALAYKAAVIESPAGATEPVQKASG